jgi:predicted RNA binding protein YcfA (HicA-like mRNA interferase family)
VAISRRAWEQLKARTADDLIRALVKDGWVEENRSGATRGFVKHARNGAGRTRVVVHYHPGKTYGPRLLKALIESTRWTEKDLKRLKLIKRSP